MKTKFTKGPWVMKKGKVRQLQYAAWVQDKDGDMIHVPTGKQSNSEKIANARLIAAAPNMYDMLNSIENDKGQIPDFLWNKIQGLLEKIRG